jgi:hypothetical protein
MLLLLLLRLPRAQQHGKTPMILLRMVSDFGGRRDDGDDSRAWLLDPPIPQFGKQSPRSTTVVFGSISSSSYAFGR